LWAIWCIAFRLPPDGFWRCTPKRMHYLLKHLRQEHERQFTGFASLRADLHNSSQFIDHKKRAFVPQDFMPSGPKVRRISGADFIAMAKAGTLFGT
jgi:hypothetical protein